MAANSSIRSDVVLIKLILHLYQQKSICIILMFWLKPEAIAKRSSVKKVLLKFSQNSPENTCNRDSFLTKLQAWGLLFFEKESPRQVFSCEFCEIFKNTFFIKTSPVAASWLPTITWFVALALHPQFYLLVRMYMKKHLNNRN